jgi:hypothetical protein
MNHQLAKTEMGLSIETGNVAAEGTERSGEFGRKE